VRLTDGVEFDRGSLQTRGTPTTKFIDLISFRAEGQNGERRGRPGLFIASFNLQEGLGFEEGASRYTAREDSVRGRERSAGGGR
jgi:hypothetical protein